jgi:putative GTP pyrophosphokinase
MTILDEYKSKLSTFQELQGKLEDLATTLLNGENIHYHQITSRVKRQDSLIKKIKFKGDKYNNLSDITDILGLRIITYFEDEVDKVAKIMQDEFDIDWENSVDKRDSEINKFGYRSLHYIISFKNERTSLTDWKKFQNIKVEVQIRSILQHAWAEIEHDIGYKAQSSIPNQEKRNFFRISALLETADKEFVRLRTNLNEYEEEVAKLIVNSPSEVLIDKASLNSYIQTSDIVNRSEEIISSNLSVKIVFNEGSVERLVDKLTYLGISTIKELDELLIQYQDLIIVLATKMMAPAGFREMLSGNSIFYLPYAILTSTKDKKDLEDYCAAFFPNSNPVVYAERLINIYNQYNG